MGAGIDYGRGQTNIDHATGIRYGVISQNDILQAWADSSEADYGEAACPKCGQTPQETPDNTDDIPQYGRGQRYSSGCADFYCGTCNHTLDNSDVYGEEPIGWHVSDGEYEATNCLDNAVMVLKSPYYTNAQFCSPCVPGAGNLNHDDIDGVKTYCFGHDWFDSGKAPYPVYRVADNTIVQPENVAA